MDVQSYPNKDSSILLPQLTAFENHVVCFEIFHLYVTSTCYGFPSKSYPAISIQNPPWAGLGTRPGNPACDDKKPTKMSWRFSSKYDKYDSQLQIGIKKKRLDPWQRSQPHPVTRLWRMRDIASEIWSAKSLPVLDFLAETVHAPLRGHHRSAQVDVKVPHCPFRKWRVFLVYMLFECHRTLDFHQFGWCLGPNWQSDIFLRNCRQVA